MRVVIREGDVLDPKSGIVMCSNCRARHARVRQGRKAFCRECDPNVAQERARYIKVLTLRLDRLMRRVEALINLNPNALGRGRMESFLARAKELRREEIKAGKRLRPTGRDAGLPWPEPRERPHVKPNVPNPPARRRGRPPKRTDT